eukprot:TRINITY_DN3288_c0_g1_i1.p1 TRINITY_DN3288_c0_g1~~TRINITY_DN3288_c0_g1_i1.p1  ORF type:complete len:273 (+),score=56.74 TRINITY_DN3288_c0_g1_i1:232-1050(+)
MTVESPEDYSSSKSTLVSLTFSNGLKELGEVVIELFPHVSQRAVDNFVCLCTGEVGRDSKQGPKLRYTGSNVYMIKTKWFEAGDITEFSGDGGDSIYGKDFVVDTAIMKHTGAGILSMVRNDENRCSSKFALTLQAVPELDNKYLVIGRVLGGMAVLTKIGNSENSNGIPTEMITISGCRRVSRGGRIPSKTLNDIIEERLANIDSVKATAQEKKLEVFDEDDDLLKKLKGKSKKKRAGVEVGVEPDSDEDDLYEKRKRAKQIATKTRRKFF